ncbi:MAG: hypothetical protein ACK5KR_05825, partial [Breznakia sp.]
MKFNVLGSFNESIAKSKMLNEAMKLKDSYRNLFKKKFLMFMLLLITSNFLTVFLSFMVSVISYGGNADFVFTSFMGTLVNIAVNNYIYCCFLIAKRKYDGKPCSYADFFERITYQVICTIGLGVIQTFVQNMNTSLTSSIPKLNVIMTVFISVVFMMIQVVAAFAIHDEMVKPYKIMGVIKKTIVNNWKALLLPTVMFVAYSYFSNVFFASLVYDHLSLTQGINNIFHSLLYLREYETIKILLIYYPIAFVVG